MGAKVWALGNGGGGGEQSKEALWEGVSAGRVLLCSLLVVPLLQLFWEVLGEFLPALHGSL